MTAPTTVRVRIAVAVRDDGRWTAVGEDEAADVEAAREASNFYDVEDCVAVYFVEATVPVPVVPPAETIEGSVSS